MKLIELVDIHLDKYQHSPYTYQSYRAVVKRFVKETGIENIEDLSEVSDITITKLKQWRLCVLERASGSTWNNYKRHLKALLNTAVSHDLISVNPIVKLHSSKEVQKEKTIAIEDLVTVIKKISAGSVIQPPMFWVHLIRFFYYTGMRRRQLVGLKWADLDLENMKIWVDDSYNKTNQQGWIPLMPELLQSIFWLYEYIPGEPQGQVFNITKIRGSYKADQLEPDHITQGFRKISKRTGIRIGAHRLRHTMATMIANKTSRDGEATVKIKHLQNLLFHSSIKTTVGYIHPSTDSQREMLDQSLDRI